MPKYSLHSCYNPEKELERLTETNFPQHPFTGRTLFTFLAALGIENYELENVNVET